MAAPDALSTGRLPCVAFASSDVGAAVILKTMMGRPLLQQQHLPAVVATTAMGSLVSSSIANGLTDSQHSGTHCSSVSTTMQGESDLIGSVS